MIDRWIDEINTEILKESRDINSARFHLSSMKNKFIYSRKYVARIGDKDSHRYELLRHS